MAFSILEFLRDLPRATNEHENIPISDFALDRNFDDLVFALRFTRVTFDEKLCTRP